MTTRGLSDRIAGLNIPAIAIGAIEETKERHADLNVMQMNRGIRQDGSPISPSYSPVTRAHKIAKGLDPNIVSLRDKGPFQEGVNTKVEGNKVITGSTDSKSAKLERKYSKAKGSIFGLSEKYKAEYFREDLKPAAIKRVKDAIHRP